MDNRVLVLLLCLMTIAAYPAAYQLEVWQGLFDNSGNPLSSGEIVIYNTGTSTLSTVYADKDESAAATNPFTLSAYGRGEIFARQGYYDLTIKSSAGVTIETVAGIRVGPADTFSSSDLNIVTITATGASGGGIKFDSPTTDDYRIWADTTNQGLTITNLSDSVNEMIFSGNGNVKLADGKELWCDEFRARDADGVKLYDDGNNGLSIADGGTATFSHGVTCNSTLAVTGAATFSSTVGTGAATVASLSCTGAATIGTTLGVTGAATLSSTLNAGASTLASVGVTGAATVGTTLEVTGNTTVGGTLGVTGATALSSTLSAGVSTLSSLEVTGNESVGGTLNVTGAATLGSITAATITGAATVGTTLGVTGATTIGGTLGVTGAVTIDSTLTQAAGQSITSPQIKARPAGNLLLTDNGGNGLTIANGGAATFSAVLTASSILYANGGILVQTGDDIQVEEIHAISGGSLILSDYSGNGLTIADGGAATFSHGLSAAGDIVFDGGNFTFNDSSAASKNFRLESNSNAYMFYLKGDSNCIGVNTSAPLGVGLHVADGDSGVGTAYYANLAMSGARPNIIIESDGVNNYASLDFWYKPTGGSYHGGLINWRSPADITVARIYNTSGQLCMERSAATGANQHIVVKDAEVSFNEDSYDIDIRMESDDDANMFFLDANENAIGIGTGSPSYTLEVTGKTYVKALTLGDESAVTIGVDGGISTMTSSFHTVTSYTGTADTLELIVGPDWPVSPTAGTVLFLSATAGHTIVLREFMGGNFDLSTAGNFSMDENDIIQLIFMSDNNWHEVSRSEN